MASANEKLATALEELRKLQADGLRVFRSDQLSRTNRERLIENGFLQEAIKGWLLSANPAAGSGDTTPWFSSFWEFCYRYCEQRFGEDWYLSPEESLLVHAEKTAVRKQVLINSPTANNKPVTLAHGTSLFALKRDMPPRSDLTIRNGLRVFTVDAALIRIAEGFYREHPVEAQVVIRGISEPTALLSRLLDAGHTTIAGRVAGAFRRLNRADIADEILSAMASAGHSVRESDPFAAEQAVLVPSVRPAASPFLERLRTLWSMSRESVIREFPAAVAEIDIDASLSEMDELYKLDAYHSLSIEGYVVTSDLIERVATGAWDPQKHEVDRENKNALAARGYWQAFQGVREVIAELLRGGEIKILRSAHRDWYRSLFAPNVAVGLLKASELAGYRSGPVFLRGSRHIPPRSDVARAAMPVLFDLLEEETSPAVRAVLGHWLFGYVHPFPDGNGRVARFLMNALLVHGGYPWTVIRVEDRSEYLRALESASVDGDVRPFASFVARQVRRRSKVKKRSRKRKA